MFPRTLAAMTLLCAAVLSAGGVTAQVTDHNKSKSKTTSLDLGLLWAPNRGQWSDEVLAASVGGRTPVRLTRTGLVVGLGAESEPLGISFPLPVGTSKGQDAGPSVAWLGARSDKKSATASTWRNLVVPVLPGIGLVLREGKGGLRYDVQVAPGADLEALTLGVSGSTSLTTEGGCLVMRGSFGEVRQTRPVAWQVAADGSQQPVDARFHVVDNQHYRFAVTGWNRERPLVIDPTILTGETYATFFEEVFDIVPQGDGSILACGWITANIPQAWVTRDLHGSGTFPTAGGKVGCIARLDPALTKPRHLTIMLASVWALAVHPTGAEVYALGRTQQQTFPTTDNTDAFLAAGNRPFILALDAATLSQIRLATVRPEGGKKEYIKVLSSTHAIIGGPCPDPENAGAGWMAWGPGGGDTDVLVEVIDLQAGLRVKGIRIGGAGSERLGGVGVGSDGAYYVGGLTGQYSDYQPGDLLQTTAGAYRSQPASSGGGGKGKQGGGKPTWDWDQFLLRIDPTFSQVQYATRLGGSERELGAALFNDRCLTVSGNQAILFGTTQSADFIPAFTADTSLGGSDGFVVALDFSGFDPGEQPPVAFGTYVGFDGGSAGVDVVHTDAAGRWHVAGGTSRDQLVGKGKNKVLRGFPLRDNGSGLLMETARDSSDGFYMILDPQQATFDQALIYSSRIGTDGFNNAMVDFEIGSGGKLYFLLRASDPMPTTPTAVASSPFFPSGDSRNTWLGVYPSRL